MHRRLPQARCSQIHSFAGNHAGSEALIIESSLLLLLFVVFSREAEALQKYVVTYRVHAFFYTEPVYKEPTCRRGNI